MQTSAFPSVAAGAIEPTLDSPVDAEAAAGAEFGALLEKDRPAPEDTGGVMGMVLVPVQPPPPAPFPARQAATGAAPAAVPDVRIETPAPSAQPAPAQDPTEASTAAPDVGTDAETPQGPSAQPSCDTTAAATPRAEGPDASPDAPLPPALDWPVNESDTFTPEDQFEFSRLADSLNLLPREEAPDLPDELFHRPVLNESHVLDGLLRQARLLTRPDGARELRLRLDPPELGHVELRLRLRNGRLHAVLRVHDPDAARAIESIVPRLHSLFAGEGILLDRCVVDLRAASGPGLGARAALRRDRPAENRAFALDPSTPAVRRRVPERLLPVGAIDFLA
jgi:hypothetical protein